MDRDLLPHLPVVIAVARRGGFAAAAAELGMSPSAVSHAVKLVEERLGVPLFARTTRSVRTTEAGEALLAGIGPALVEIGEQLDAARTAKGEVTGHLRLNVPSVSLPLVVTPIVAEMAVRYPRVRVEVFVDDAIANIVADGFDAGIRLGEMIEQDMVTVRLTKPFDVLIVGSPAYLARKGRPTAIGDLAQHNCIAYRMIKSGGLYRWELLEEGRDLAIDSPGSIIINDALYACALARAGVGLAYVYEPLVAEDIAAGALEQVLPEAVIEEPGLFLYFPRRVARMPKLRAFIETARDVLGPSTATRGRRGARPVHGPAP